MPPVQRLPPTGEPGIGTQKETAGTTGRVGNGPQRLRAQARHHRLDQRPQREIPAGTAHGTLRVPPQQTLIEITLGVGVQADPVLRVDQLHQPRELSRVLDLVLRLEENRAEHPLPLAQPVQQAQLLGLQRLAGPRPQTGRQCVFIGLDSPQRDQVRPPKHWASKSVSLLCYRLWHFLRHPRRQTEHRASGQLSRQRRDNSLSGGSVPRRAASIITAPIQPLVTPLARCHACVGRCAPRARRRELRSSPQAPPAQMSHQRYANRLVRKGLSKLQHAAEVLCPEPSSRLRPQLSPPRGDNLGGGPVGRSTLSCDQPKPRRGATYQSRATPWDSIVFSLALKGRDITTQSRLSRPFRARPLIYLTPRALPWAGMFDPVGVDRRNRVESGTRSSLQPLHPTSCRLMETAASCAHASLCRHPPRPVRRECAPAARSPVHHWGLAGPVDRRRRPRGCFGVGRRIV